MRPLQALTPRIRRRCPPSNLVLSVVFSCAHPCSFPLCSVRVIPLQALLTDIDDTFWSPRRFLLTYFAYHDGVRIKAVDKTPRFVLVIDPQFMALWANRWHGPSMRHRQHVTPLQFPQQKPGFEPGGARKRRGCDLTVEPHEGFVGCAYMRQYISELTYFQLQSRLLPIGTVLTEMVHVYNIEAITCI